MGSKTGWIIAGVIVAFIAALAVKFLVFPAPTPPTSATRKEGRLKLIAPDMAIKDVIGTEPSGPGNAADVYHKAIEYARSNQSVWAEIEAAESALPENLAAHAEKLLSTLAPAADIKEMTYTFNYTPKEFVVSPAPKADDDLRELAVALESLCAHYLKSGNTEKAIDAGEAYMIFGWHVSGERVRVQLTILGFDMQGSATTALQQAYNAAGKSQAVQAAQTYNRQVSLARSLTTAKQRDIFKLKPPPGDVFNIIENDEDHAWRVEGLLLLGMVKFSSTDRGDQRYIENYFEEYKASDDPYFRAAATVAEDCTLEQVQQWFSQGV